MCGGGLFSLQWIKILWPKLIFLRGAGGGAGGGGAGGGLFSLQWIKILWPKLIFFCVCVWGGGGGGGGEERVYSVYNGLRYFGQNWFSFHSYQEQTAQKPESLLCNL